MHQECIKGTEFTESALRALCVPRVPSAPRMHRTHKMHTKCTRGALRVHQMHRECTERTKSAPKVVPSAQNPPRVHRIHRDCTEHTESALGLPSAPNAPRIGLFRLRWKNRQKVLQTLQKSAQIVLDFYKTCLKFRNSARKLLEVTFFRQQLH